MTYRVEFTTAAAREIHIEGRRRLQIRTRGGRSELEGLEHAELYRSRIDRLTK